MKKLFLITIFGSVTSLYCIHQERLIQSLSALRDTLFELNQSLPKYKNPKILKEIKNYSLVGNTHLKNENYNTVSITGNTQMTNVTANKVEITGNTQLNNVILKNATITGNLTARKSQLDTLSLAGQGDFDHCIFKKIIIEISKLSGKYTFDIESNEMIRQNFSLVFKDSTIHELEIINDSDFDEQIIYLENKTHIKSITAHNIKVEIENDATSKAEVIKEFYD